jgi:hypothetical protein
MNTSSDKKTAREQEIEQWLAVRKEEGLRIDPETAEVMWTYGQTMDPYNLEGGDLPAELWQVGREYFARAPESRIWVHFGDLPKAVEKALWAKHSSQLAFPAGLGEIPKTTRLAKLVKRLESEAQAIRTGDLKGAEDREHFAAELRALIGSPIEKRLEDAMEVALKAPEEVFAIIKTKTDALHDAAIVSRRDAAAFLEEAIEICTAERTKNMIGDELLSIVTKVGYHPLTPEEQAIWDALSAAEKKAAEIAALRVVMDAMVAKGEVFRIGDRYCAVGENDPPN